MCDNLGIFSLKKINRLRLFAMIFECVIFFEKGKFKKGQFGKGQFEKDQYFSKANNISQKEKVIFFKKEKQNFLKKQRRRQLSLYDG